MFKNLNPGALGLEASLFETLELAEIGNFQAVDLDTSEMRKILRTKSADDVKGFLEEKGLRFGGWGLPVDFKRDEGAFRKDLGNLSAIAEMARELGYPRAYTWITPFSDKLPFKENFELHVNRLVPIAKILDDYGCVLGLEFVAPKTSRINHRYEFIHDMDGILRLREAMKTKNVGLLVDCWHWYTSHGTVEELRRLKGRDIVYVHVNDAPPGIPVDEQMDLVRRLPGETGVIDIVGFLKALKEIGYDGPVTPEPFDKSLKEMPKDEAVRKVGKAMDKVWQSAGL